MNFKKWVKSIQTAGYNGARTLFKVKYKTFVLLQVFVHLAILFLLVTFKGYPVFEIRKNLNLRKILVTPKIFLLRKI